MSTPIHDIIELPSQRQPLEYWSHVSNRKIKKRRGHSPPAAGAVTASDEESTVEYTSALRRSPSATSQSSDSTQSSPPVRLAHPFKRVAKKSMKKRRVAEGHA